jgi:hypothetical protein
LADARRTSRAQGLEESLDHGTEQFVCLEVERRLGQSRVTPVQQRGAELVQSVDGTVQEIPDDRLGGGIAGEFIQVPLNGHRGEFFGHFPLLDKLKVVLAGDAFAPECVAPPLINTGRERRNKLPR